jgi:hypothetical protein
MTNWFLSRVLLLLGLLCWQRGVVEAQQEQLNAARNRWNITAQGIPFTSYNYAYAYQETRNGVADADRIIQVQNGVVTSVGAAISSGVEPGDPVDYPNVEGMFGIIQDAIDDDSTVIQIRYDQENGFPTKISILYANNQESLEIQIRWSTLYSVIQLELDRNRNKWNDLELVDYDYSLQVSCLCFPDYTSPKIIQVRDSEIVFVAELETGEEASYTDHDTVDDLFAAIQRAIDNLYSDIDVEYNERLGYPMEVSTNPSTQISDAAGTYTQIMDLAPLQDIVFPSAAPTKAPVQPSTDAPTKAPVQPTTDAPTKLPTDAPTKAPSEPPSNAPTKAPSEPPSNAPTKAPVEPPTNASTKAPSEPPSNAPTKAPVEPPTNAPTKAQLDQSPPTNSPTGETSGAVGIRPRCWSWFGLFGPILCRRNPN